MNEDATILMKSELSMLATKFENLRMLEDESIADFYLKLCAITKEIYNLGEPHSHAKLVQKVLQSLPTRFKSKVKDLKECKQNFE